MIVFLYNKSQWLIEDLERRMESAYGADGFFNGMSFNTSECLATVLFDIYMIGRLLYTLAGQ